VPSIFPRILVRRSVYRPTITDTSIPQSSPVEVEFLDTDVVGQLRVNVVRVSYFLSSP